MAERIAISDAPEVVLGSEGVEQSVPVVEKGATGPAKPGRTTISAMAAFFGGGGGGVDVAARFNLLLGPNPGDDIPNRWADCIRSKSDKQCNWGLIQQRWNC